MGTYGAPISYDQIKDTRASLILDFISSFPFGVRVRDIAVDTGIGINLVIASLEESFFVNFVEDAEPKDKFPENEYILFDIETGRAEHKRNLDLEYKKMIKLYGVSLALTRKGPGANQRRLKSVRMKCIVEHARAFPGLRLIDLVRHFARNEVFGCARSMIGKYVRELKDKGLIEEGHGERSKKCLFVRGEERFDEIYKIESMLNQNCAKPEESGPDDDSVARIYPINTHKLLRLRELKRLLSWHTSQIEAIEEAIEFEESLVKARRLLDEEGSRRSAIHSRISSIPTKKG